MMEHSRITLMGLGNYVSELEEDQDDCSELEEDEEDQDDCSDDCFETDISDSSDDEDTEDGGGDKLVDGMAPTPKQRKLARQDGLRKAKSTGKYPEFKGVVGAADKVDPCNTAFIDFVKLLWPDSLCEHIAEQTNLYATQCGAKSWKGTHRDEIWVFIGIILEMGIHRLPKYTDYWSTNRLLGVQAVKDTMPFNRFKSLRRYLHCDDNTCIVDSRKITSKIHTVLETLSTNYLAKYHPSQELSVDEMMIKYKGRKGGKIHMPRKPVKLGFKVWCCSCSCCRYLCTFDVYSGRLTGSSGTKVSEKGLLMRVVKQLVEPFHTMNHVVYMDNFYTSGPLIVYLRKHDVFVVGTMKMSAAGFPSDLKGVVPHKGEYVSKTVDGICYFVFNDRKVVCFAINVFPETMPGAVFRLQADGTLCAQSVPLLSPCL
ncbi:piggyBac transposable element-derived protein 4-like [Halichondria panicea]|uniref:piggyBac transposable element-derived protein 4-like n=1 Tax=Halichondria panicea TaxID=6063 RepID=UPI00312BB973